MKIFTRKIFFSFAIIIIPIFTIIPLASCSTAKVENSPEPLPTPPVVDPTPPIQPPVEPPTQPPVNPPTQPSDYQRFYSVKKEKFKDGYYVGLLDNGKIVANNQFAELNVHYVPQQVSKLPSLFVANDILTLLNLKDANVAPSSINIIDYNDSLRTSGIQNWFEYENTHPSRIPHTDTSGRAKYKVIPMDDTYKIKPNTTTTSSFDYSYIDVQINFSTPNESVASHSFNHTFLFAEGINEVRHGTPPLTGAQPLTLTTEQKNILGNNIKNPEFIVKKFTSETDHTIFNVETLKHFVEIKHMKPPTSVSECNSNEFDGVTKLNYELPTNLSYVPILKSETNRSVITVMKQTHIEIDATDKNEQQGKDSVKWHNFGKTGYIDTFHRGRSTYGGIGSWNNELTWAWTL